MKETGPQGLDDIDVEDVAHLTGICRNGVQRPQIELGAYVFKCAETDEEFRQVHRLNYRTFVEEVGQYPETDGDELVDKFHDKNIYFIALRDGQVVGMLAAHDQPPFSVAERLPDPTMLERLGTRHIEARLFAVEPDRRLGPVSRGLLWVIFEYARANGYSHLIISGIASRRRLYERMGFRPLGPPVQQGDTAFVPMAMDLRSVPENIERDATRIRAKYLEKVSEQAHHPVSLLPGPVQLADEVRSAVSERPESHRGEAFIERFERIRSVLGEMVGGLNTAIMVGSGTLANEVVGANIAADRACRRGLVLVNGEFGRRLADQAMRHGLDFEVLTWPWGAAWDLDQVREALERDPEINWIWAAHLETSTALVNAVDQLFDLAEPRGARVCLDCVSSLGAADMDISRAHMATGTSGKSIGSLAGLAFIFAADGALDNVDTSRLPTYLDLHAAMEATGPRFTLSSPLLRALEVAIEHFATPEQRAQRYQHHAELGAYVRRRLKSLGFEPLVDGPHAAPVITTFRPPEGMSSEAFFELCLSWGFEISGLSGYLRDRGMVQIATMGDVTRRDCAMYFARLRRWMRSRETAARSG